MIFVTVGTQKFPMDRLMKQIDALICEGRIAETFFVQSGHCGYSPKNCESKRFVTKEEAEALADRCSVLICHAGVGSILMGLKRNKKIIIVPRLEKYGEHVDNHQLEIAEAFSRAGYVRMVEHAEDLGNVLAEIPQWQPKRFTSNKEEFNRLIISLIEDEL